MQSLTKEEVIGLLRAAKAGRERDWLMILTAFWHGLRASEVVAITRDDVQDGYLTVKRLKGSLKTTQALIRHADPLLDEATAYLDLSLNLETNQRFFPIHRATFWRLIRRYAKAAGIPQHKAHPHALKHSIAMQMIDTMGIEHVRQLLGHKSLSSTGEYLKVSDEQASQKLQDGASRLTV